MSATQSEYVDITINGVLVKSLKVMNTAYPGFCAYHRRKFLAGQKIAFKHRDQLTPEQKDRIFGGGTPYHLTIIYPLERDTSIGAPVFAKKKKFTPNQYQQAIREKLFGTIKHLFVKALAGCTKTSTAIWLCEELGEAGATRGKDCVYLAFNASIRDEVREPLAGTGVKGYTTHGFMLNRLLKKAFPSMSSDLEEIVNDYRSSDLFLKAVCDDAGYGFSDSGKREARKLPQYKMQAGVTELVGLIKNWAVLPTYINGEWEFSNEQRRRVLDLVEKYRIVLEHSFTADDYADMALRVATMGIPKPNQAPEQIDFDDMLWLPLVLGLPFPKLNLIIADESQDFNACQLLIIQNLIKEGARAVVIGDIFQSLYLFRGADCESFNHLLEMLKNTKRGVEECVLPLNYRCSRSVIRHANGWVPDLQGAREEEGEVVPDALFQDAAEKLIENNDQSMAVICRVNAPLVVTAYYLMSRMIQEKKPEDRKAVCILGKKTAAAPLKSLIRDLCRGDKDRSGTNRISDRNDHLGRVIEEGFLTRLRQYRQTQIAKLGGSQKYAMRLEEILNNCTCLEVIAATVKDDNTQTILDQIDSLFVEKVGDPKKTIVLTTVHRAKGLEWGKVYIIRPDLLPHPNAMPNDDGSWSDEQQQEENACYVAATRARDFLGYVSDWPFKEGKPMTGLTGSNQQPVTTQLTGPDPLAAAPDDNIEWKPPPVRSEGPTKRAIDNHSYPQMEEWELEVDEVDITKEEKKMEIPEKIPDVPVQKVSKTYPINGHVDDGEPF